MRVAEIIRDWDLGRVGSGLVLVGSDWISRFWSELNLNQVCAYLNQIYSQSWQESTIDQGRNISVIYRLRSE